MIYVIHADGYCKIGASDNVRKRLMELQVGSPHPLTLLWAGGWGADIQNEAMLHREYAAKRIRGEWFLLDNADIAEIANTFGPNPLPPLQRPEPDPSWIDDLLPIELD